MRRLFSVSIFILFLTVPGSVLAAGLIATPKNPPFKQHENIQYTVDRAAKFTTRYCGRPIEESKPDDSSLEVWISYNNTEQPNTRVHVTNVGTQSKAPDSHCVEGYYGDPTSATWTIPEEIEDGSQIVIAFKDQHSRSSAIAIRLEEPPEGSEDPTPQIGASETLSLGDLDTIFDSIKIKSDFSTPQGIAQAIISVLLSIAGLLGLLAFIWSGYLLLTSGGDTAKAEKAKKGILWAITGILLIIFAQYLINAVNIFGTAPDDTDIPREYY